MTRIAYLFGILTLFASAAAVAGTGMAAATGIWLTADEDGYVQIYEKNGKLYGLTVGSPDEERPRKDVHNPDADMRDRDLLGIDVLKRFEYVGDLRWEDGRAYDPNNGKTYKANMWLEGPHTLKLRGYIGFSMFGRTDTWTRVDVDAPGLAKDVLIGYEPEETEEAEEAEEAEEPAEPAQPAGEGQAAI